MGHRWVLMGKTWPFLHTHPKNRRLSASFSPIDPNHPSLPAKWRNKYGGFPKNGWFISWKIPVENGWWLGVTLWRNGKLHIAPMPTSSYSISEGSTGHEADPADTQSPCASHPIPVKERIWLQLRSQTAFQTGMVEISLRWAISSLI